MIENSNAIRLVEPTMEYEEEIWSFRQEIMDSNDQDQFAGCGNLRTCGSAKEWIDSLKLCKSDVCSRDQVPSDTYIAVRSSDHKIVGVIDLRHHINHPILGTWGGHMGYTVRPTERGRGYAREMLRQNLQNCRNLNIYKILITCDADNPASEKTILANAGVFEKEIEVDGCRIKRYWITLD